MAALELMDEVQMVKINRDGGTEGRMWEENPTLFIKHVKIFRLKVTRVTRQLKENA